MTTSLAVPRLLAGWHDTGAAADLPAHLRRYGPNPQPGRAGLIDAVTRAGLRGRGGGGFPTGRKLASVAAHRRRPVVLVNACEGEPASAKDAALLDLAPHLVLDGAVLAAAALNAVEVVVAVHEGTAGETRLARAIGERSDPVPVSFATVPARYVASEESAIVNFFEAEDARPTTVRPFVRGVDGRPTLVDNAETLAHLALIARFGPDWFREVGTPDRPGTYLVTVGGAVRDPGVYEVAGGTSPDAILNVAGGPVRPLQAVLVGGYGGVWEAPGSTAAAGVALLLALPAGVCGLAQTAHLLRYLAGESARQCGPCTFGLPAIAADFVDLTRGRDARSAFDRLHRRLAVIPGRGACSHPDGAVRLAASALEVFAHDLAAHLDGRPCRAAAAPSFFPVR